MALRVYNTLKGEKEDFVPIHNKKVGMYVCGITAYDLCHIGHARSAVVFDTIFRYLRHKGYEVTFVRNFTDIDDKIIRRANEEQVDYKALAERYIEAFYVDMGRLGLERPTFEPRATEHIADMIRLIQTLIAKGYAYERGGDVFFSVEKFPGYGKLSKRSLDQMQAGARVEIDEKKENPLDFALWKASKPGEPWWESPWGPGRPGWHIECSVMSQKYLGETFDIHGGGKDLIFPHHENEIAQSEAATGKPFARYWIHNGFVNLNKEKMSKSLGNILTIKEILKTWHPEIVRLFLLSSHYRSPLDFSEESLAEASSGLTRLYETLETIENEMAKPSSSKRVDTAQVETLRKAVEAFPARFEEAMDDDFNTAQALGYLFDLQRNLNSLLGLFKGQPAEEIRSLLGQGLESLRSRASILGLLREEPSRFLTEQRREGLRRLNLTEEAILRLIEERNEARKAKDWKRADAIRNNLLNQGIALEDTPTGTQWKLRRP